LSFALSLALPSISFSLPTIDFSLALPPCPLDAL
jgi:hypothetical protein